MSKTTLHNVRARRLAGDCKLPTHRPIPAAQGPVAAREVPNNRIVRTAFRVPAYRTHSAFRCVVVARGVVNARVLLTASVGVLVVGALGAWWMFGGGDPTGKASRRFVDNTPPPPIVDATPDAPPAETIDADFPDDWNLDSDAVDVADGEFKANARKPKGWNDSQTGDDDDDTAAKNPSAFQPAGLQP